MESNHVRRLRESGIPVDLLERPFDFGFSCALSGAGPGQLIPKEDWPKEFAAMAAEEECFWKGRTISVELMVELPFWLMIPDCDLSVSHGRSTVKASIRGRYVEVSDGPWFFNSHRNVIFVGPLEDLTAKEELSPRIADSKAPIHRPMKTVVIFRPEVLEDAVLAFLECQPANDEDRPAIRRINRAYGYLQALAYAFIPFLNRLITSYRVSSRDPFAFQVSQWDVPAWFYLQDGDVARISLMPYWDNDWYPTLKTHGQDERMQFNATDLDVTSIETRNEIAPGMLEILDAQSLLYRGHLDDAVRSIVTAIEVALEAQIAKLLKRKGYNENQVEARLSETWNNFDERILDYERISGTRIPGPILSFIPYINGIRLKSELNQVRRLRHKIVHEGLRVDIHSRGPMLRAIETMTMLFHWLCWEEGKSQDRSRSYVYYELMRGNHIPVYPFEYRKSEVAVLPRAYRNKEAKLASELIQDQYIRSIEGVHSDIELFSLMTFAYLGIESEDSPPNTSNDQTVYERFMVSHKGLRTKAFCMECDGVIDSSTIEGVLSHLGLPDVGQNTTCMGLCIINHEKNKPMRLREQEKAISVDAIQIADQRGLTLMTAADLCVLVRGMIEHKWNIEKVNQLLFLPGRQGLVPPVYRKIGNYTRFYSRLSVMSLDLSDAETIEKGDILGIRLPTGYHEEEILSMEVEHRIVSAAIGPCKVGIKTKLNKGDLHVGQFVFLRK
jgi:hypothetical protein